MEELQMEDRALGEALNVVAKEMGIRVLSSLSSRLNPDEIFAQASEILGVKMKETFSELLQDPEAEPLRTLIDRLFSELDEDAIINAIAPSLGSGLVEWFKHEEGAIDILIRAMVQEMNFEEFGEMVADRVANRVQITPD